MELSVYELAGYMFGSFVVGGFFMLWAVVKSESN